MFNYQHAFCFIGGIIYGLSARLWPGCNPFTSLVTTVTYFLGLIGVLAIAMLLGAYADRRTRR